MIRSGSLTSLLLVILCCLCCFLILRDRRARFVINLARDPSAHELSWVVRDQRGKTHHLSKHPKVVFRCPDDGPDIEYPSHASDDLTEIVMTTNDDCGDASNTDGVIIVHTAVSHFKRRQQYRNVYGNYSNTKPYRLKVVFMIGSVLDANLLIKLERENRDFGDTVVGSFLDTYHNLTIKAVMSFRWLASTCRDVKLLIKMDDDVFFDVRKFFTTYWIKVGKDRKTKSIHCLVWHRAHVERSGKWKVQKDVFAGSSYPFPYCAGFFAVISPDLIKPMYLHGRSVQFFWIDDVFMYGMVSASIGGVHFIQLAGQKGMLAPQYEHLQSCRDRMGPDKCSIWAALTSTERDFDFEYSALLSPELLISRNKTAKSHVVN